MRDQDKPIFSQAAQKFVAWILARPWNDESLDYVGRHGYVPKNRDNVVYRYIAISAD